MRTSRYGISKSGSDAPILQSRNRDREVPCVLGGRETGSGLNWETEADMCTRCARQTAPGRLPSWRRGPSWVLCAASVGEMKGIGGREDQEGGIVCVQTADSPHRALETNTAL